MNASQRMRLTAAVVALLAAGGVLAAQQGGEGGAATPGDTFDGFTRPSLEVTVGSRVEGLVAEVLVEEGHAVKQGDVLLKLDDTVEKIETELSRLLAESEKSVEAMKLIAAQKQNEFARVKALRDKGSVTGVEYEQKELEVKVAQLNVEVAESRQQAARLQYQRDLARLAQRQIVAPVDGIVTRVWKDPGEAVERLEKVAEIVQLDPLEIVLNVPVSTRGRYADGQAARVRVGDAPAWHEAKVKMVDPVADFASNTYRVKVTLPNPGGKLPAGLRVSVDLKR